MAEDTDTAEGVSLADREDLVAYARRMAPDNLARARGATSASGAAG